MVDLKIYVYTHTIWGRTAALCITGPTARTVPPTGNESSTTGNPTVESASATSGQSPLQKYLKNGGRFALYFRPFVVSEIRQST